MAVRRMVRRRVRRNGLAICTVISALHSVNNGTATSVYTVANASPSVSGPRLCSHTPHASASGFGGSA
jgi:hypothetical protein